MIERSNDFSLETALMRDMPEPDNELTRLDAGTEENISCPDCGVRMIRLGTCFSCPICGFGSCE